MTSVRLALAAPTSTGTVRRPSGSLEWRPTKRRDVAGDVILPAPFTVGLADTPPVIEVDPTEPGWAWQVVERVQGGSPKARYLTVPDSATVVDYADLVEVDRATLDPVADTTNAWQSYVDQRAVPVGGTTGQVLAKASNTDRDTAWVDQTGGGGGGAVASVNGHIGTVVLGASDVGADPAGAASAAQAFAIQRANHTGTQAATTITGLAAVATSGSYTDLSSKPTIPAAYTDEQARDAIGAALVAGTGLTKTVDDAADTITLGVTPNTYEARIDRTGASPGDVAVLLAGGGAKFQPPATVTQLGLKRNFGAVGDMKVVTDGVCTAASTTLTSATAGFTLADVGKTVAIPYAGADNGTLTIGQTHVTTIAGYVSATQVTLTTAPVKSIVGPRTVTDAGIGKGAKVLTSATAAFTPTDVGKKITIPGAGQIIGNSGGSPLDTKIVGYTSATQVTVDHTAQATVSAQTVTIPGAWIGWGTDDTTALQTAATTGAAQRRPVEVEPGRYLTTAAIAVASYHNWIGHGPAVSVISPVGAGFAAFQYISSMAVANMINDVSFRYFEIDCSGVRVNTYGTGNKAIYIRPVLRLRVEGMYLHDTSATALGCDWLPYGYILSNNVEWGGAQVSEFGGGGGGSGIGIGTGMFQYEPLTVFGNQVRNCGNNGIFTEAQSSNVRSRGIRIIGNQVSGCGQHGISDRACEGTIIANNQVDRCTIGISTWVGFVAGLYSRDVLIADNTVENCLQLVQISQLDGDITIRGNTLFNVSVNSGTAIQIDAVGTLASLTVEDNNVHDILGRGVWVKSLADRVHINRNKLRNCGNSTASMKPAIVTENTIAALYVRENVAYDTRAGGSKQQSYGFQATAGTVAYFEHWGNDFQGNATGTWDTTGATITATAVAPAAY